MQAIADTALIFMYMWILMTFVVIILWAIFDGLDYILHYLSEHVGTRTRAALLLLVFSAMLAAATTAAYLHDAQ
jgi:hypothetical protein